MENNHTAPRRVALAGLAVAEGYASAGIHEIGGNNRGDQIEEFQRLMGGAPGDPWCADFVCTCLVKGYARCSGQAEDRPHLPGYVHAVSALLLPLSGYCPALAAGARQRFRFRSRTFTPLPGDLVLFDFNGVGEPHHVGFVREVHPDGSLTTVEGNTTSGSAGGGPLSEGEGDGVFTRLRGRAHVFGFVHFA